MYANVVVVLSELSGDALKIKKYEEQTSGSVTVVLTPRSKQRSDRRILLSIDVPLSDDTDHQAQNEENIVQAYFNALVAGMENEAIDRIAICSIEGQVLQHDKFASVKEQIADGKWDGTLFARACKKFVSTKLSTGGVKKSQTATLSETDALLTTEPKQKILLNASLVVANGDELARVKSHITLELNKA